MVAQTEIRTGMPLVDFIEQYNRQPFELTESGVSPLMPNVAGHQFVARILFRLLDKYITESKWDEFFSETPFVLTAHSDWVKGSRTPDLSLIKADRWVAYVAATPDWKSKPIVLVPDLVIEIVSPNDLYSEIDKMVDGYLADGVRMVWVLDPQRRKVRIHEAGSSQEKTLGENDMLNGGLLLSGFNVPVKQLFG